MVHGRLQILAAPTSTIISKEYVLTALLKLSTRFKMSGDSIRALTVQYQSHIVLELQSATRTTRFSVDHFGLDPALLSHHT